MYIYLYVMYIYIYYYVYIRCVPSSDITATAFPPLCYVGVLNWDSYGKVWVGGRRREGGRRNDKA